MATWTRKPQEKEGQKYFFSGQCLITAGINETIHKDELRSMIADLQTFVKEKDGVDYRQVYEDENGNRVWMIDNLNQEMKQSEDYEAEDDYFTILYPHEYWHGHRSLLHRPSKCNHAAPLQNRKRKRDRRRGRYSKNRSQKWKIVYASIRGGRNRKRVHQTLKSTPMNREHFYQTLVDWLVFPFKIEDVEEVNDDNHIFTVTTKDKRQYVISAQDVKKMKLLKELLQLLPFSLEYTQEIEENCGAVWVTLNTGKIFVVTYYGCEDDQQ